MVGVQDNNGGGPGKQWLGPAVRPGGIGVDRGEAASERSMRRGLGREREDMAGERSGRTSLERDGEGGIECERENDKEKSGGWERDRWRAR